MRFTLLGSPVQCDMEERSDGSAEFCFTAPLWAGYATDNDHRRTTFTRSAGTFTVLVTPPRKKNEARRVCFNVTNGDLCWRVAATFPGDEKGSVTVTSEALPVRPEDIFLARQVIEHPLISNGSGVAEPLRVFDYGATVGIEVPSSSFTMRVVRGQEIRRSIRIKPISTIRPRDGEQSVRMGVSTRGVSWMLDVIFAREGLTSSLALVG